MARAPVLRLIFWFKYTYVVTWDPRKVNHSCLSFLTRTPGFSQLLAILLSPSPSSGITDRRYRGQLFMWVLGMQTWGFMLMHQAPYQLSHQATSLRLSHNRCQSPILLASGREKAPYSHSMGLSCFHTHASRSLYIYDTSG